MRGLTATRSSRKSACPSSLEPLGFPGGVPPSHPHPALAVPTQRLLPHPLRNGLWPAVPTSRVPLRRAHAFGDPGYRIGPSCPPSQEEKRITSRRRRESSSESVNAETALVAETLRRGTTVQGVARRRGVCSSLLHRWRREARGKAPQQRACRFQDGSPLGLAPISFAGDPQRPPVHRNLHSPRFQIRCDSPKCRERRGIDQRIFRPRVGCEAHQHHLC
ncbi:transposase [Pseudoroseomonas wenyumeiae]